MKQKGNTAQFILTLLLIFVLFESPQLISEVIPSGMQENAVLSNTDSSNAGARGAFFTGKYTNLFKDLLGKSDKQIDEKITGAFKQLFLGDDNTQRIYYPVGDDMGYIEDINNNDVRTEGMSYGIHAA